MAAKDERYLNVTLRSDDGKENDEEIVISFSGFLKVLKRFLLLWIVAAILVGIMIPVATALFSADQHKNLTALISFNYSGIEKGQAPDGSLFDVNTLKTPSVIEAALTDMDRDLTALESIRQGISIEGIIPADAISKITAYKNLYEQGSLQAAERMLDVTYYPTQYRVTFNYSKTAFSGQDAVTLFNTILDKYREYFFEMYGFNQALGSAVTAIDYKNYDYAEAVDVFDSTLGSLQDYVTSLSEQDTTRYRSNITGYTFSDLSEAIQTLRTVNLDLISSYVTVNNVTKDSATLMDYYNYRIEVLSRERAVQQERLETITDSINSFVKDTIIIYGENQDTSQYTQSSAQYDALIKQKIEAQTSVSTKTQQITAYQQRIASLKGKSVASDEKIAKVENDLEQLNASINDLLNKVNATANEYYETVSLAKSYEVLVPASSSALRTTKNVINSAMEPLLITEALLFVLYFGISFIFSLIEVNRKRRLYEGLDEKSNPNYTLKEPVAVTPENIPAAEPAPAEN